MKQLERGPDAPYYVFAVPAGEIAEVRRYLVNKGYKVNDNSSISFDGEKLASVKSNKGRSEAAHVIHIDRETGEKADKLKEILDSFDANRCPF